ncbi:MAG: serine/threonine protein kinase [Polyangiaceae bacterium]|nr:serine/threonine protein kinase [Polyangiaceae bacterium]
MKAVARDVRAPLDEALESEIRKLDVALARMWQVLAGVGIGFGLLVYFVWDLPQGVACSGICVVGLSWFTALRVWLRRPSAQIAILLNAMFEALLPSVFLLAIGLTQGAAYALGSYVSPMIFTAMIVAATARLRPNTTIIVGVFHGAAFAAIYFFYLRGQLSPVDAAKPLYSPQLQVTRALSFGLGGAVTFGVTHALRRAIGRAERNVRSHDLFGKYRLGERLGIGGMGAVHRALYCPEGGFERTVAVKLLHAHLAEQPDFIQAFRHEAELSARLVHPNIVQVLDFGRIDDAFFLAMEFVDGATLGTVMRSLVEGGRVAPIRSTAWVGHQMLAGLAYSHAGARDAQGSVLHVVHRDLCPANVLVSNNGEVKISDFGVAKALGDATFSETKTVVGHMGYMAPEQLCADPIDERCDLFAVGVILWEMLAARPLFRRSNEAQSIMALMNREIPPIASLRADIDPAWDVFFARALAERSDQRFSSAAEMSAALEVLCPSPLSGREETAQLVAWVTSRS